jgi:DNA-binding NarL/FixJ family response regulator
MLGRDGVVTRRLAALTWIDEPDELLAEELRQAGCELMEPDTLEGWASRADDEQPAISVVSCEAFGPCLTRAVQELATGRPDSPIIVICRSIGVRDVRALLNAGVDGVVLRDECARTLEPTLQAIAAGIVCVPCALARQLQRPVLSTREKQVVGMIVLGLSNAEIASRLYLAESTVKSHVYSAFGKLGVRSRSEAAQVVTDPELGHATGVLTFGAEPLRPAEQV